MELFKEFWDILQTVWGQAVFGIGVGPAFMGLFILFVFVVLRGFFARLVIGALKRMTARTETTFDDELVDALDGPARFMFVIFGLFAAIYLVQFPEDVEDFLTRVVRSMIAFNIFWAIFRCVEPMSFLIDRMARMIGIESVGGALKDFIGRLLKFLVICLGAAAIMEEWDFNVAALLGGLGLMGMAVAFGAQNLVANLFAGLSIILDHIFDKGDWVKTPGVEGTVEDIGFRTTKIRQFDKALVTVPNNALIASPVINFSKMTNRRIYWKIGLLYNASEEQLRAVVNGLRDYIHNNEDFETNPDRATTLIHVDSFNASSIDIMLYCFTKTTNWAEWMQVKEDLAYFLKNLVEEAGTSFAYPSTSVYVEELPFGAPEIFAGKLEASREGPRS